MKARKMILIIAALAAVLGGLFFASRSLLREKPAEQPQEEIVLNVGGEEIHLNVPSEKNPEPTAEPAEPILPEPEPEPEEPPILSFVQQDFFYDGNLSVELEAQEGWEIFYTTDGNDPVTAGKPYSGAISLKTDSKKSVTAHNLRAAAKNGSGEWCPEVVHTYFLGENIKERFNMMVVSLSVAPDDLNGEKGIFKNYNESGSEWERDVYVEMFEPDGKRVISQAAGVRVHGAGSRSKQVKSLRLYARSEYDEKNNWFVYPFFDDYYAADGSPITRAKRLTLRCGGNDMNRAFMRDEVAQTLALNAGFEDAEHVCPCVVFLNGAYQSFYWIQENYNDYLMEERYGEFEGTFEFSDGDENRVDFSKEQNTEFPELAALDLTDDANYAKVCEQIDIENYLTYYAINILLNNEDWPQNNSVKYRYVPAEGESYGEAPFDGKWRFYTHDMDMVLGINGLHTTRESLDQVLDPTAVKHHSETLDLLPYSALFAKLTERKDCKEFFIRKAQMLMNGAMTQKSILAVVNSFNEIIEPEMKYYFGGDAPYTQKRDFDYYKNEVQKMRTTAMDLSSTLKHSISMQWQYIGTYTLQTVSNGTSAVCVDGLNLYGKNTVKNYAQISVPVYPTLAPGEQFAYWMVDGKKVTDETFWLPVVETNGTKVVVELVTEPVQAQARLAIKSFSAAGDSDYIVIYNPSSAAISTEGYFVSDGGKASTLQTVTLAPGEELKIFCKSYIGQDAPTGTVRTEFNLKAGEKVILGYQSDLVESVTVPDLHANGTMEKDLATGKFREILH